jgi:uncharacterized protein YwgA
MTKREDVLTAVLMAAGGQLTGRVRFQKTMYLLEQLGVEGGFNYEYHYYCPYSRDLDNAIIEAAALGLIKEEFGYRGSDGARFSIFRLTSAAKDEAFRAIGGNRAKKLVEKLAQTNVTILELAATVDWLWRHERRKNWREEITRRKPVKADGGRLDRAIAILQELDLSPPETQESRTAVC